MTERALSDVVVLELATGVAGPYCGKLLADMGAQVVKVEPPGGDPTRAEAPLAGGESAFFAWLNANKLGVELQIEDEAIEELARHADIVLHDARGAAADDLDARLTPVNPRAVVISLTPYGRSGPRADWEASPLTEWATGGYHYFAGDPLREPLALPGHQAEMHSGLQASIAALAALRHARRTGEGQRVEVSHQEAVLHAHAWLTTNWTHAGKVQMRTGSLFAKCADGYVYLFNLVPYQNLFVLMERYDLLADEALLDPPVWWERFPEVLAAFSEWAADKPKQEIYHAAQELRVAVSPVNTMADVAANEQLEARGVLGRVTVGGEEIVAPGFPIHLHGTPCDIRLPAPGLGEHNDAILASGSAWANADVPTGGSGLHGSGGSGGGPLAGIRIIEMTAQWAGPIAGRHLADLGAEVIKVELATKPATRTFAWVGDDMTWPRHYNRSGYFNKLNRNKKGICLDVAKPEGRALMLELIAKSDVLLENYAARVMGQLGLSYDELKRVNPGIVMCRISGYGATGPQRDYSAYGSNIETTSGLASLLGYGPGDYFATGTFYADPVTGNHASAAILAALHARERTGEGQWIELAMLEAVLPFFAQPFLRYTAKGELQEPMGNRSPRFSPQDVYPTVGRDCWLALTVRDQDDWSALAGVLGRPAWVDDPAFASADGRRARAAEIDEAIREWCATRDHIAAAEELQAAGVPAAPVMPNWEIVTDNHLNDRGALVLVRHAEAGTLPYLAFPWRLERTPGAVYRPAPMFAEHNREVLEGLLGLTPERVRALYEAGITSDEPQYAGSTGL